MIIRWFDCGWSIGSWDPEGYWDEFDKFADKDAAAAYLRYLNGGSIE